jgi:hypothetical protein
MTNRSDTRFFLLRLLFPLIYAGFFVVQLFIHFDTSLTHFSDRYQILYCLKSANQLIALENSKSGKPLVTKFRLNRNFEPSAFSIPVTFCCKLEKDFIFTQHVWYESRYVKEPLSNTASLRGPPFID